MTRDGAAAESGPEGEDAADAQGERSARAALLDLQLKSLDDDALHGRLDALAASAPGLIDVEDEDAESPPVRWHAPDAPRPALAARAPTDAEKEGL